VEVQSEEVAAARAEIETLQGAMSADDKRLRDAEERVWPGLSYLCAAPEKMADEILSLQQQLGDAEVEAGDHYVEMGRLAAEIDTLRQERDAAQREASDEFSERHMLQHEASDDYAELERLRAFAGKVQSVVDGIAPATSKLYRICDALAELDAGTTEPAPVAEPVDAEEAK
jgi:predicted  nucleic acid-binding Zn-ribbon protein